MQNRPYFKTVSDGRNYLCGRLAVEHTRISNPTDSGEGSLSLLTFLEQNKNFKSLLSLTLHLSFSKLTSGDGQARRRLGFKSNKKGLA